MSQASKHFNAARNSLGEGCGRDLDIQLTIAWVTMPIVSDRVPRIVDLLYLNINVEI